MNIDKLEQLVEKAFFRVFSRETRAAAHSTTYSPIGPNAVEIELEFPTLTAATAFLKGWRV